MAERTLNTKQKIRTGTAVEWASSSLILLSGEMGWDSTNKLLKIGDGTNTWANLSAYGGLPENLVYFTDPLQQIDPPVSIPLNFVNLQNAGYDKSLLTFYTELAAGLGEGTPQVNSDWDAVDGVAEILNKPVLTEVQVNASTTNAAYPVCFQPSTTTGTVTGSLAKSVGNLTYNPSTQELSAPKVLGAVFNDYAEYRISTEPAQAGRIVCENGDDTVSLSIERLQPGALVISDTFGFSIGRTDDALCPIAVAGRVLAYPYRKRQEYKAGDPVCAAPNGTIDIMTRKEVMKYPDRMIGIISAIPEYEYWGSNNVKVDGRIWIKVK